jgi:hypothetical protein
MLTDANGSYYFDELDAGVNYFVHRPAQQIMGVNWTSDVSGLLSPGLPLQIIDSFDNHQLVQANPVTPSGTSAVQNSNSSALGGERDMFVKLMSGIGKVSLRSNAYGIDVLQYDTASVMGYGIVTWDGVDYSAQATPSMGLGNIDLTEGGKATGLLLKLGVDQTGEGERLRFRLYGDTATEFSEASLEIPVTGGMATATAFLPFDEFAGSVGADQVNAIQMFLGEGTKSVDAQIDWIGTAGPTTYDFAVVPEPSSVGLTLLALLLMGICRRRWA